MRSLVPVLVLAFLVPRCCSADGEDAHRPVPSPGDYAPCDTCAKVKGLTAKVDALVLVGKAQASKATQLKFRRKAKAKRQRVAKVAARLAAEFAKPITVQEIRRRVFGPRDERRKRSVRDGATQAEGNAEEEEEEEEEEGEEEEEEEEEMGEVAADRLSTPQDALGTATLDAFRDAAATMHAGALADLDGVLRAHAAAVTASDAVDAQVAAVVERARAGQTATDVASTSLDARVGAAEARLAAILTRLVSHATGLGGREGTGR